MGTITADAVLLILTIIFPTGEMKQVVKVQPSMMECTTQFTEITSAVERLNEIEKDMDDTDIEPHIDIIAVGCFKVKIPLNGRQA